MPPLRVLSFTSQFSCALYTHSICHFSAISVSQRQLVKLFRSQISNQAYSLLDLNKENVSSHSSICKIFLRSFGISYDLSSGTRPLFTNSFNSIPPSFSSTSLNLLALSVTSWIPTIHSSAQTLPTSPEIPTCILRYGSASKFGVRSGSHCTLTPLPLSSALNLCPWQTTPSDNSCLNRSCFMRIARTRSWPLSLYE